MRELSPALRRLIDEVRQEARREEFPVDAEVYAACGLDPTEPVFFAGDPACDLAFFARDLGKDEVQSRQPLCGAAGRLVRRGVCRAFFAEAPGDEALERALEKVLLTNTVPYKPPGNKAYSQKVKQRFRPFLERLLVFHWRGSRIVPLGTEALQWFSPCGAELKAFAESPDRFASTIDVTLTAEEGGERRSRLVTLAPLPHPSPLNQKYYAAFPEMLQARLREYLDRPGAR